jgi:bifunctional DNA-binding transcriptional regulator/antitoxin component of YhaV-PrlF toxin-antitoxin module
MTLGQLTNYIIKNTIKIKYMKNFEKLNTDREDESTPEKPDEKTIEKQDQRTENPEFEQQIQKSLDTVSDSGVVRVYDKSGKFVFDGNPDQLMIFWKNKDYGKTEDIGGISDEEGKSIFRFGAIDGKGFTDRKRIEDLFQQLEGKVASRKQTAEDAQKLIELRAQLGIKQETPVVPQVEESSGEIIVPKKNEERERGPIERENLFDDIKAEQVLEVFEDWVKYDVPNLYTALTGKFPKLEKGKDYSVNSKGEVDMASYREARRRLAEQWLRDPTNAKWFEDCKNFKQEHDGQDLSYEKKTVKVKQTDGKMVEKEKWTTPYFYQDGWIYYESNFFDEANGKMKQPDREETQHRVYFNVEGGDVAPTFSDIIKELSKDPELQKLGFQIKTADARVDGETDKERKEDAERMAMNFMNQKDKIVLYLGDKGIEHALPIIQKYAEKNRQKFSKEGVLLAQKLRDSSGQEVQGISVTSETKGMSPDPTETAREYRSFSDMQSKVIESTLKSLVAGLKTQQGLERVGATCPNLKKRFDGLGQNSGQKEYLKTMLADEEGRQFMIRNLKAIYPQWSKAFGMREDNIAFKKR